MSLLDALKKMPTLNEMSGGLGEWLAKQYATVMTDALVLHDVLIDGANGYTSQIDLVLIGSKGIYVVEVKMYSDAKIYGDGNKSTWYYYNHGKKYEIYSPIKQNKKHVAYLKNLLKSFGDVPCFSIITMICEDFKVSNINRTENKETVVCNSLPAMKQALQLVAKDKPVVWDERVKQRIYEYIQAHQYDGKAKRQEHKKQVIAYKEQMKAMEDNRLCPYCKTPLILRKGKYGEFYGCSNYPKCKYTLKK